MKKIFVTLALVGLLVTATGAFAQDKGNGKAGGAGVAAAGKEVFESNCAVCHNADSTERKMGPGLKGLFQRAELANKKKVSDASVIAIINEGGNGMPPFGDVINAKEKADVLAYLKSL